MATKKKSPSYMVRPSTAIITRGFDPSLSVGSARPAVFRSSTYVFSSPEAGERAFDIALGKTTPKEGENVELIYSRLSHPNAEILENHIVPLEPKAKDAAVFNSGMSAIATTCFNFLAPGSSFVYTAPVYGGTHHLIHELLMHYDIKAIPVAAGDTPGLRHAIQKAPSLCLVLVETPANPTLRMSDISAAVAEARKHKDHPLVVVDNTFMGPAFQHPLDLGADLVIYSATKFFSGFSDMLGGIVLAADKDLIDRIRGTRAILGTILQPDECWLLDSRLPTVMLRMNRQSKNTERIVEHLKSHEKITEVIYPALFNDSEQVRIRNAQCQFPGSLFSLRLQGGKQAVFDFIRNLRIAKNAVSLGGMETLVCHPGTTTHSEMSPEERAECGIDDDLVRISVGVEDWRDLLKDFQQALDTA